MDQQQQGVMAAAVVPAAKVAAAVVPAAKSLAPGFRFHPTDEELVTYYLRRKACGKTFRFHAVSEVDVYKSEPWDLAGYSPLNTRDMEWYFFCPVDRKYGNGSRINRATGKGYWKATGKDRSVRHKGQTIGMKKTLVFHCGRAPVGKRTNWVMHEYRLVDTELGKDGVPQDLYVLCRIFQKSGLGPPNGDRYAPFVEEEWADDEALLVPGVEAEEDMAYGDDARTEETDREQEANLALLSLSQMPVDSQTLSLVCKREMTEDCLLNREADPESISLFETKRSKHSDLNSTQANGSEDSTTTRQEQAALSTNITLLEFPLLESIENRASHPTPIPSTFDAATLDKSVPPGYLKFINNLESEILNVSMERETLKIEVMRAQAMINILQSRFDLLSKENEDLRSLTQ